MTLIFIKAIVVVILVLGLSTIAEKVSTKVSGLLSGLPLGVLIVLLFFAIEFGVDYVQDVALFNIQGLFATLAFVIGYYLSTFYTGKFEVIFSLIVSFTFYLTTSLLLSFITPHVILTPILVFMSLLISGIYFSKKEDFAIIDKSRVTIYELLFRSAITIVIFLTISSFLNYLPQNFAGIFSSFPTVLLLLIFIIHMKHGNLQARTILKNNPFGLTSVVAYSYVVYFAYPSLGIVLGTLIGLACAVCIIYVQAKVLKYFRIIK